LSSAILYAAIIAIWLGVLIPRWLRRDTSQTKAVTAAQELIGDRPFEGADYGGTDVQMSDAEDEAGGLEADRLEARREVEPGGLVAEADEVPVEEAPRAETESEARTRVLAARRRMLLMLGSLTVVALGMVFINLAAWWVALPPIAMLGGYLMMLREASRMDAEQSLLRAEAAYHEQKRRDRAATAAAAAAARAEARRVEAERRREEEQTARIIDISGRVKDELYDQYADEKRAVGD
jgi:hypothetical protein